jgi:Uma2 family endonuclease
MTEKKLDRHWTYKEYLKESGNDHWEIIDGKAYPMSPVPSATHQRILLAIATKLQTELKGMPCEPFIAPFDVRLPKKNQDEDSVDNVVQPDLLVICDKKKIDERGCKGAPDFIIEILSNSTAYRDTFEKLKLYEASGVEEYWIVNPCSKAVLVHLMGKVGYEQAKGYRFMDDIEVSSLHGLVINISNLLA